MTSSMFRGGRRFKGRERSSDEIEKVPLRGLFADGIWQCNCEPRMPAERFQTKNGGKNHGRWCKGIISSVLVLIADRISLYMPETATKALQLLPLGLRSKIPPSKCGTEQLSIGTPDAVQDYFTLQKTSHRISECCLSTHSYQTSSYHNSERPFTLHS